MRRNQPQFPTSAITIRSMDICADDGATLARLAERDSKHPLDGPVLGVEVEDRLLAAISLSTGRTIADPFIRTGELTDLLRARAAQLQRRRRRRLHRRRGAPAVAGPPGRIKTLPHWG